MHLLISRQGRDERPVEVYRCIESGPRHYHFGHVMLSKLMAA
jgi:hypothetical protein